MRKIRPIITSPSEVTITRQGEAAIIKYNDPSYATTQFEIGPELDVVTDQEIINLYNDMLRAQAQLAAEYKHISLEVPLGSLQIEYHPRADQWTLRGNVLRCLIDDSRDNGEQEPVITIDDEELTWRDFGRLLCTYAGWGMRIEFVPDDEIHRRHRLEVREPKEK